MLPIEIKVSKRISADELEPLDDTPALPFRTLKAATQASKGTYNTLNQTLKDRCEPHEIQIKIFVGDRVLGPYPKLERAAFVDILDNVPSDLGAWSIAWWTD